MKNFTGQRLGAYQLGGQLRADAFSSTYPSYQPTTKRAVAVKILSEELAQTPNFIERFSRDMQRVTQLNHPNIAQVLDLGVAGTNAYLVMRLVTGSSIEGQSFSTSESMALLEQVAAALDAAHQNGVVHGNLNPTFIFLENNNTVVTDFGIAKLLADSGVQLSPSPYFAPEQWRGEKISPPTDIYALGIIAFELLTGQVPFHGTDNLLMRKHLNEEPPLISSLQPSLPASMNAVFGKVLAKDAELRYDSAGQFVEALHNASEQKTVDVPASDLPSWLATPAESPDSWSTNSNTWEDTPAEDTFPAQEDPFSRSGRASSWDDSPSESWGQSESSNEDMNYYEWEQQQREIEAAQAKANEPDIPLPDLPDMFEDAPSAKPSTGSLSDDYVPEWFMGVEELSDDDVPDFLKGASLDESLLNPLGQAAPPRSSGILQQPPPSSDLEMPDVDDFMADVEPAQPQIRRIESAPLSEDAVSLDDLFDEEPYTDLRSTSELTSVDGESEFLTAEPDEFALGISSMLGEDLPGTEQGFTVLDFRAEDDFEPSDDDFNFGESAEPESADSGEMSWLAEEVPSLSAESDVAESADMDWLGGSAETESADAGEMSWLAEETPSLSAESDVAEPADMDWLLDESPATISNELDDLFGNEPSLPSTGDSWMGGELEEAPELEGASDEGEPDWLSGYDHEQEVSALGGDSASHDFEAPAEPGETPDWFGDIDFSNVPVEEPHIPQDEFKSTQEVAGIDAHSFLDFDSVNVDELFGGVDVSLASAQDLSFSGLMEEDDFLADFPTAPSSEEIGPASDLPFELPSEGEDEEIYLAQSEALPEWMKKAAASASAEQVVLNVGGMEVRFDQVSHLGLPDDLRELREQMMNVLRKGNGIGEVARTGTLAGVEGALAPDTLLSTPGEITLGRTVRPTETQQERVTALKQALQGVQEEAAQKSGIRYDLERDDEPEIVKRPRHRTKIKYDRLIITFLMLVGILAPFTTDGLHFLAQDPALELNEDAEPLAAAIDVLGETRNPLPVLVAFEYGPTAAGELDPLATAVLRDILANDGRPVVISTNPIGLLHAEQIFRDLAQDETFEAAIGRDIEYGDDYLILRLLAGGAVGVRQLARSPQFAATMFTQDINGNETGLEIERPDAENFAFVVVIGERDEDTRTWAEHFSQLELPKFALVTSAAEPLTRPYLSANAYEGMVVGNGGTLMYDTARNTGRKAVFETDTALPDPTISRWHSVAWGAFAATLIITLGATFNFLRGMRRRRA